MSQFNQTPRPPDEARRDGDRLVSAAEREARSARDEAVSAGRTIRDEAAHLASDVKSKAYEKAEAGIEQGKSFATSNLDAFTSAIRKASEELGSRDQSVAASLVRQAAGGLEQVSQAIQGQSLGDLTRAVAGFARRQPTAFLIGAALAGVALGRFARSSADHDAGGANRSGPGYRPGGGEWGEEGTASSYRGSGYGSSGAPGERGRESGNAYSGGSASGRTGGSGVAAYSTGAFGSDEGSTSGAMSGTTPGVTTPGSGTRSSSSTVLGSHESGALSSDAGNDAATTTRGTGSMSFRDEDDTATGGTAAGGTGSTFAGSGSSFSSRAASLLGGTESLGSASRSSWSGTEALRSTPTLPADVTGLSTRPGSTSAPGTAAGSSPEQTDTGSDTKAWDAAALRSGTEDDTNEQR